jgi:hypothetical protein
MEATASLRYGASSFSGYLSSGCIWVAREALGPGDEFEDLNHI